VKHIRTTIDCLMQRARQFHRDRFDPFLDEQMPALSPWAEQVKALKWEPHRFNDNYDLRRHERADYSGMQPELAEFLQRLYLSLRKRNFPTYVHTAHRSEEEQLALFKAGHSKVKIGAHQRGAAFDLIHSDRHWKDMPRVGWQYIGLIGKDIIRTHHTRDATPMIEWGGDWEFYDPAHWQLAYWKTCPLTVASAPIRSHPASVTRIKTKVDYNAF